MGEILGIGKYHYITLNDIPRTDRVIDSRTICVVSLQSGTAFYCLSEVLHLSSLSSVTSQLLGRIAAMASVVCLSICHVRELCKSS